MKVFNRYNRELKCLGAKVPGWMIRKKIIEITNNESGQKVLTLGVKSLRIQVAESKTGRMWGVIWGIGSILAFQTIMPGLGIGLGAWQLFRAVNNHMRLKGLNEFLKNGTLESALNEQNRNLLNNFENIGCCRAEEKYKSRTPNIIMDKFNNKMSTINRQIDDVNNQASYLSNKAVSPSNTMKRNNSMQNKYQSNFQGRNTDTRKLDNSEIQLGF